VRLYATAANAHPSAIAANARPYAIAANAILAHAAAAVASNYRTKSLKTESLIRFKYKTVLSFQFQDFGFKF